MIGRNERGFTLLETLLAIAALATLALALGTFSLGSRPGAVASGSSALPALVARARSLAEASGDGATLSFVPDASGFQVTLFPYRPDPGSAFSPFHAERVERFRAFVASSAGRTGPFAVFISSAGSASWAAWSPSGTGIASEPACDVPLGIVLAPSAQSAALAPPFRPERASPELRWFTLACADATLVQS